MKRIILFATVFILATLQGMAQQEKVTGRIMDTHGETMPGVPIQLKGTTHGTTTDADGKFSIDIVNNKSVLVVRYIGFKDQEITVGNKKDFKIVLEENVESLNEVVVVGYGTVQKKDLTGSVAGIKSKDILRGGSTSGINQALQGRLAGVAVSQNDGAPGSGISIQIRGANSFTTSTEPLYIIDGIPFASSSMPSDGTTTTSGMHQTTNPLSSINPQDIESIDVLKDASATAIYGSRGANGVVLITTKKGKQGKDQIVFSANYGVSKIVKKINMIDAADYATYMNEQKINQSTYEGTPLGTLPYPGITTINPNTGEKTYLPGPQDYASGLYPSTDWQDQIYQNAASQEYNIALSGASEKGSYLFSSNILDQKGSIVSSGLTRYSFRTNLTRKVHKWIEIGTNMSFSNALNKMAKTNASDNSIIKGALYYPPTRQILDPNNDSQINWFAANPYLYTRSAKDWLRTINFFSSSYMELTFTKNLKFRQNIGYSYFSNARNIYYNRNTREGMDPTDGYASQSDNYTIHTTFESILTYNKQINKNNSINAMGGTTYEGNNYGGKSMYATGFPNDITEDYNMSAGINPGPLSSSRGESALLSFLGRVNYTFRDKYLFTASMRHDGSSKFAKAHRWSNFSSFALAWRASEEPFIKNLNVFDNLKFRTSYGETGNQGIGPYATRTYFTTANYPINGTINSGFANDSWRGPENPNLKWETTKQVNLGSDMGFLKNRLSFTFDYYFKKTSDLLQNIQIPMSTGFSNMTTNFGDVTNYGLEISTRAVIISKKDLQLDVNANISFNRNKISGLQGDQFAQKLWTGADQVFLQRNGCPIGVIYGYVEDGFYDSEAEVRADPNYAAASPAVAKAMIGEVKYKNNDSDPAITDNDREIIGNVNPKFTYGFTANLRYKRFTTSLFFQGTYGNDIFNGNLYDVQMMSINNITQTAFDGRWTEANKAHATYPKAYGGFNRALKVSNRFVEDGSYLRLKNLSFGYEIKSPFKAIEKINVTASLSNLFTLSKYSWYDPDVNAFGGDPSRRGVDMYSYPSSRTLSFGVQCTF